MYRLATKRTAKRVDENASVSFFQTHTTTRLLVYSELNYFWELELIDDLDIGRHLSRLMDVFGVFINDGLLDPIFPY